MRKRVRSYLVQCTLVRWPDPRTTRKRRISDLNFSNFWPSAPRPLGERRSYHQQSLPGAKDSAPVHRGKSRLNQSCHQPNATLTQRLRRSRKYDADGKNQLPDPVLRLLGIAPTTTRRNQTRRFIKKNTRNPGSVSCYILVSLFP